MDNTTKKMYDARLEKQLNKLFRFDEGVMTLREFFTKHKPLFKKIYTREHSEKRICLEYVKLEKKVVEYAIFYTENRMIMVSKMVYDYFDCEEKPIVEQY